MKARTIRATTAALVAAIFVSGCTSNVGQAARAYVAEKGQDEAAAGLENAEWYLCRASPVGAVIDRYGAKWEAWRALCSSMLPEAPE